MLFLSYLVPPPLDDERHVEAEPERHGDGAHLDLAEGLQALEHVAAEFVARLDQDVPVGMGKREAEVRTSGQSKGVSVIAWRKEGTLHLTLHWLN